MFITKEQLDKRLSSDHNFVSRNLRQDIGDSVPIDSDRFAKNGIALQTPRIPDVVKPLIGALAISTTIENAAEVFGISEITAGKISRADSSMIPEKNEILRDQIYEQLADVREKAKAKLDLALGFVTKESLEAIPAKDQARQSAEIAAKMSNIIERTIPKDKKLTENGSTHLHLYSPEQRKLNTFNVVTVNDTANDTTATQG